jgi:hypothetical protein
MSPRFDLVFGEARDLKETYRSPRSLVHRLRQNTCKSAGRKATCARFLMPVVCATLGISIQPRKSGDTQISQLSNLSAERRAAKRYRMSTAVVFHWNGPENERFQAEGVSRDMSVNGVFVLTATCPPANAVIQMEVLLPVSDGVSKARMKSDMRVLRVEHDVAHTRRSGFSAYGKGFSLRTFSKKASRVVAGLIKDSRETAERQL